MELLHAPHLDRHPGFGQLSLAFPSSVPPTSCLGLLRGPDCLSCLGYLTLLQGLHGVLLGGASSLLLGLVSCLLLNIQQKLTGLLTHQQHVKCFAHLSLQQPRKTGVMVTVIQRRLGEGRYAPCLPRKLQCQDLNTACNTMIPNV